MFCAVKREPQRAGWDKHSVRKDQSMSFWQAFDLVLALVLLAGIVHSIAARQRRTDRIRGGLLGLGLLLGVFSRHADTEGAKMASVLASVTLLGMGISKRPRRWFGEAQEHEKGSDEGPA
jgi:prolipoprotein diacylglyceryltransferase